VYHRSKRGPNDVLELVPARRDRGSVPLVHSLGEPDIGVERLIPPLGARHMPVKNMMCAFGVPGNMIHGTPGAGFSVIPVDFSVAPGMYTT
jgi:hypothetical protein